MVQGLLRLKESTLQLRCRKFDRWLVQFILKEMIVEETVGVVRIHFTFFQPCANLQEHCQSIGAIRKHQNRTIKTFLQVRVCTIFGKKSNFDSVGVISGTYVDSLKISSSLIHKCRDVFIHLSYCILETKFLGILFLQLCSTPVGVIRWEFSFINT